MHSIIAQRSTTLVGFGDLKAKELLLTHDKIWWKRLRLNKSL